MKKILTNNKFVKLVLNMLGLAALTVDDDGKAVLSEEEKSRVSSVYGKDFLTMFLTMDFRDESMETSTALFDEAVKFKAGELVKEKDKTITEMQASLDAMAKTPEPAPVAKTVGAQAGVAYAIDMAARHNKLVADALASANPMDFTRLDSSSINVTDLNTELSMTMPQRYRLDLFVRHVYMGIVDADLFTRIQSNTDYLASSALITEVSQAFTAKWTPKGTASFQPVTIPYRRHKINVSLEPADIIKSWLGYLYEQGKKQAEMPIVRFIIENLILPKVQDDVTRSMLGKGKYVAPAATITDGSAGGSAISSMDGIETLLVEDYKAATRKYNHYKAAADPFSMTNENLLKYIHDFAVSISPYFIDKPLIYCSEELLEKYQAADFAVNGKYTGTSVGAKVRFTGFTLQPVKAMYNSPIIFSTPKQNMVMLVDYAKAANCVNKIEEYHYSVDIMGEYSLSVGFKVAEAVYAAVPSTYDPADSVIGHSPAGNGDVWETGAKPNPNPNPNLNPENPNNKDPESI